MVVNTTTNGTYYTEELEQLDRQRYELVYVALTLLLGTLSALIASFLGLRRRRRRQRHDPASASSVHGTRRGSDGLRQDEIRL